MVTKDRSSYKVIGTRPVRPDGVDKVTGRAQYGADIRLSGMLRGHILRSPHAHAIIKSIDTSKAMALPGVKAIITGADLVPAGKTIDDLPDLSANVLAGRKALYRGHAIAAVAALTDEIAREAAGLIKVDYEVLPAVLDVREAMQPGAPILNEAMRTRTPSGPGDQPDQHRRSHAGSPSAISRLVGRRPPRSSKASSPPGWSTRATSSPRPPRRRGTAMARSSSGRCTQGSFPARASAPAPSSVTPSPRLRSSQPRSVAASAARLASTSSPSPPSSPRRPASPSRSRWTATKSSKAQGQPLARPSARSLAPRRTASSLPSRPTSPTKTAPTPALPPTTRRCASPRPTTSRTSSSMPSTSS